MTRLLNLFKGIILGISQGIQDFKSYKRGKVK
jgi:hypothetical protein